MTTCTDDSDARAGEASPDTAPGLCARVEALDHRVAALEARLGPGSGEPAHRRAYRGAVSRLPQPRTVPDPGVVGGLVARSEPVTAPVRSAMSGLGPSADLSRLPMWAGAVVTVGGVVMLLILAATAGWLSPMVRVSSGALLGAVLVGAGGRVAGRSGAGTAATALTGTGVLALFCSVAAATAQYALLPVLAGLAACLALATGGIALADRWRSLPLALGVLVAADITLPIVTGGPDALCLGLALLVQVAAAWSALRTADRARWAVLNPVAALATAVLGLLAGVLAVITPGSADDVAVCAVAVVALALGTAVAVLGALRPPPAPPVLTLALSPLPLIVSVAVLGGVAAAAVAGTAALALAGVAATRPLYRGIRIGAAAAAGMLTGTATALLLDGDPLICALLAESLVLVSVAAVLRMRSVLTAGAGFAVPGVLMGVAVLAEPSALAAPLSGGEHTHLGPGPVGAGLLVLLAAAAWAAVRRAGLLGPDGTPVLAWLPAVLTGLYGAAWLVVVGAQRILPGPAGFLTGHVLVTVGITVLGLVLLARGVTRAPAGWAGFAVLGAALVKLVVFDLVALDGMGRVAAFIGAGLVLLAAGGRYANRVAASAPPAPSTSSGSAP